MPKIQEMGGSITYLRKYGFSAVVNITGGDDDNDGAEEPTTGKQEKTKSQPRKEEPKKNNAPPVKTEEKKKEENPDAKKRERVQTLWNRTKVFHTKDEFEAIVQKKWNVRSLYDMSDTQMSEWASYVGQMELKKLNEEREKEKKEKELAAAPAVPESPPSTSDSISARSETPKTGTPWTIARPDQVARIEELLKEINWDSERKIKWWETYRNSHKIETSAMVDLSNTQASSLIVYLENKLREVKLDTQTSPPSSVIDPAEEEARKINEENQRLALEDKVPF